MPTRLPVLLQSRKSAAAGVAKALASSAQAASSTGQHDAPEAISFVIPPSRIIPLAISRRLHLAVNEDGAEVIDVRESGTWTQEIAQTFEKTRGVVVGKKRGRIEAKFLRSCGGLAVHVCPGGILRRTFATIGTIGIRGQRSDAVRARQFERKGERIFL